MSFSVREAAREAPTRIALVDDDGALTWAEVAARLPPPGAPPVVLTAHARRADVLRIWSLLDAGVPFALLHARWTAAERAAARRRLEAAAPTAQAVVFTSGSTGRPKGVCLSAAALGAAAEAHARALPWAPGDRWLLAMPLGHVGGLSILTRALWSRGAVALGQEGFAPDTFCDDLARLEVTLLSLVPTMLDRLLERGVAYHDAGLSAGDRRRVEEAFRDGSVRAICATSTLAAGVNLPARLVVVCSTLA